MGTRRSFAVGLPAVFATLLVGCAGKQPSGLLGRFQTASSAASPNGGPVSPSSAPNAFSQTTPSRSGAIASAFKRAGKKVQKALTIEPKVVSADDPVRLSSQPEKVGPDVYCKAARLYESQGNLTAAAAQYAKALEVSPKDVTTLVYFARLCDRSNRFDQAISLYRRAIDAAPNVASTHNDLGLCYARKGDTENSLAALDRAIQLEPSRDLYRNNIATVLVRLGRTEDALAQLAAVHGVGAAHYNLACLLYRNQQPEAAIRHLVQALDHDPALAPARRMLAELGGPRQPELASGPGGVGNPAAPRTPPRIDTSRRVQRSSWTREAPLPPSDRVSSPAQQTPATRWGQGAGAAGSGSVQTTLDNRDAGDALLRLPPPVVELGR